MNKTIKVNNINNLSKQTPLNNKYVNSVVIFPFEMVSGYVNLTEKGIISNSQVSFATYLQKVFDGKSAIRVVWENSTKLYPSTNNSNLFKYQFNVGKFYLGIPIGGQTSQNVEIEPVEGQDDFIAMKSAQTITVHFEFNPSNFIEKNVDEYDFMPNDEDKYKFYLIPELGENKLFIITDSTFYYDTSINSNKAPKIIGADITFTTILDQIQNSGRAIEQYVQFNAPGEPFAYPKIVYTKDLTGRQLRYIELDETKDNLSQTCYYVQVELQGTAALGGINVIGRYVFEDDNGEIVSKPWSWLTPSELRCPVTNSLNKTALPSTTFNFIPNADLEMWSSLEWIKTWKESSDPLGDFDNAGRINVGWLRDWENNDPKNGLHKSNLQLKSIWDKTWTPFLRIDEDDTWRKIYNMKGCPYTNETLEYLLTDPTVNILYKNSFVCLNNPQLPLSFKTTKPYFVSNIPLIGGLIAGLCGDRSISDGSTGVSQEGLGLFVDYVFLKTMTNLMPDTKDPIGSFIGCFGGDNLPKTLGVNCYNTSLFFKLSDEIMVDNKIYNTTYLGQTTDENGNYFYDDKHSFTLPDNFNIQNVDRGFVIDKIIVSALFNGNIRLSFFNMNKQQIYATTISSNVKWLNGAYNNWQTDITLGTWPSEYVDYTYKPTWPKYPQGNYYEFNIGYFLQGVYNECYGKKTGVLAYPFFDNTYDVEQRQEDYGGNIWVGGSKTFFSWKNKQGYVRTGDHPDLTMLRKDLGINQTYSFSYGEIYSSRDDFIEKNKYLVIKIDGSEILFTSPLNGDINKPTNNIKRVDNNDYQAPLIELKEGVYEYKIRIKMGKTSFMSQEDKDPNKDNYVVVYNLPDTYFGDNWETVYRNYYKMSSPFYTRTLYIEEQWGTNTLGDQEILSPLVCYTSCLLTITLKENLTSGFTVNISDAQSFFGSWESSFISNVTSEKSRQVLTWAPGKFNNNIWNIRFQANLNIAGISLIKR